MPRIIFIIFLVFCPFTLSAQCDIKEMMMADGTMYYHGETILFYKSSRFQLSGNLVTDKEHYFLKLQPVPYPEKPLGKNLKSNLQVKLSNDSSYILKLHDVYYRDKDTSFIILYLFDTKDINPFTQKDVEEVKLDLGESAVTYTFLTHRDAIRQQFSCFIKKENRY